LCGTLMIGTLVLQTAATALHSDAASMAQDIGAAGPRLHALEELQASRPEAHMSSAAPEGGGDTEGGGAGGGGAGDLSGRIDAAIVGEDRGAITFDDTLKEHLFRDPERAHVHRGSEGAHGEKGAATHAETHTQTRTETHPETQTADRTPTEGAGRGALPRGGGAKM